VVVLTSLIPDDTRHLKAAGATEIISKSDLTGAALVAALRRALSAEETAA
jgi:hypothetical protein